MSARLALGTKKIAATGLCNGELPTIVHVHVGVYLALAIKNRGVLKDDVSLSPTVRGNSIVGAIMLRLVCDHTAH